MNVSIIGVTDSTVTIQLRNESEDINAVIVYVLVFQGSDIVYQSQVENMTIFVIENLNPNTTYRFDVTYSYRVDEVTEVMEMTSLTTTTKSN